MSAHQPRHNSHEHEDPSSGRGRKKPSRSIVRVACNACRSRKIGCDASRPTCSACHGSGRRCVYDTQNDEETRAMALRRENAHLQFEVRELSGILRSLTTMPDQDVLDYIRQYHAASTGPNARAVPRVTNPSTWQDMPLPLNLPEHYLIDENTFSAPDLASAPSAIWSNLQATSSPTANQFGAPNLAACFPSISPVHIALLHGLDISYWTSVPISTDLVVSATSLFFATVDQSGGYFDSELFLRDLVTQQNRFCSRLMTSSLLFVACQMFATFDLQAATVSPQFLAEARIMVNAQSLPDDYCTVAALLLLGLGCPGVSVKESFALRGCEMAQRLQTSDQLAAMTIASTLEVENMHRFRRHIMTSASNVSRALAVSR